MELQSAKSKRCKSLDSSNPIHQRYIYVYILYTYNILYLYHIYIYIYIMIHIHIHIYYACIYILIPGYIKISTIHSLRTSWDICQHVLVPLTLYQTAEALVTCSAKRSSGCSCRSDSWAALLCSWDQSCGGDGDGDIYICIYIIYNIYVYMYIYIYIYIYVFHYGL